MKFLLRTRKTRVKGSAATARDDDSRLRPQAAQSTDFDGPAASRDAWGILHRALVVTAGVTTIGLVLTWLAAAQIGACQRLASRGLLASEQLGAMLLGKLPGTGQDAKRPADPVADIQQSSRTLERRITGVTGRLLTPESSAALTEVRASWRQVEEVLTESGTVPPAPAEQRSWLIEKVQRLAAGWLRLAASLTNSLWSAHRLPAYVAVLACLLMVLVSFSASLESKVRARGMASMLEGMVEQVRSGQLLDAGAAAGGEGARGSRDAVGGLAQTFCLLIRVLRGQYQAMMKLLDLLSPGVAVLTGDQRIVAVNESFCRLVGRPRDSILGQQLHQILPSTAAAHGAMPPDSAASVESEGSGRSYRSHLARVLPGDGDDGVLVLLLEDSQEPISHQSSFQELQRLYAEVLESVSDALVLVDRNGTVTDINHLAENLLGYSRGELAGTGLQALQHTTEDANEVRLDCYFTSSEWNLENTVLKTRMVRKDRTLFSAELKFRQLGAGGSGGYMVNVRDATQDELAELLTRDRLQVIESIARSQPLELVLSQVTSLLEHQVSGSCCAVMLRRGEHMVPAAAPRLPAAFRQCLQNLSIEGAVGAHASAFFEGKTVAVPDIASQPGWEGLRQAALEHGIRSSLSSPIFSSEGRLAGMIAVYAPKAIEPQPAQLDLLQLASRLASVCIEQSELNSQLAYRAHHDALTGLLNRPSFEERLKHAIAQAGRHQRLLSILSLDLDRFKVVNDTLGHAAGDDLIRQLANRLAVSLRETDIVARWGGDEFVIGLLDIRDREAAQLVADKLLETIKAPFSVTDRRVSVGVSIGLSVFPSDGTDLCTLIRRADIAMYQAKKSGRNSYRCYNAELGETDRQRLELETELHGAVERGEIALHYQPLIDLKTGALAGLEALARWRNPRAGMILPSEFIPIAEETGLVFPIGSYAIHEACRQAAAFERAGCGRVRIAVNVSSVQFARADFVDLVAEAIREAGIDPGLLELELTESVLMEAVDESASRMARLKALGVSMCVDDFGVGYSSLGYLQRLPIDNLKIDRSFVNELGTSPRTPLLVESIVSLARSLGMKTTAEGVETLTQLRALEKTGCDLAQGYLLGRPCPAGELLPRILSRTGAVASARPRRLAGARGWIASPADGHAVSTVIGTLS